MHFLCDAIDLKHSVEGKSLTTVLDEVQFIVNLYRFLLPMIPQANPSFPKVCHLPLSQAEQLRKLLPLFLLTPLCWGYLNSQVRINKMVNSLDYNPCPSRLAPRIHPFIFLQTPQGFISLSRMLVEFSLKLLYSTICGKIFKFYGVHIPGKCIDSRHFYSCPSPIKTRPQVLAITP